LLLFRCRFGVFGPGSTFDFLSYTLARLNGCFNKLYYSLRPLIPKDIFRH
jgi:hypothetical protein